MRRKNKSKFWFCALVLNLACIALLSPVPYTLSVHAQSATPDTYSGQASNSEVVVHFTEQGAKFIGLHNNETDNPWFEAPIGSVIYVSATAFPSESAVEKWGNGGLYQLWISKSNWGNSAAPNIFEDIADVNGTGNLLASGTTTKTIYNDTVIHIEWDYYYYTSPSISPWVNDLEINLEISPPSSSPSPTPIPTPLSPSTTTVLATTDSGATVNLGISGSITSSQMSNVKITTNPAAATTTVSFTVTGKSGTTGSSNMSIPQSVVPYGTKPTVFIDNQPAQDQGYIEDSFNFFVWYTTGFSTHQVTIVFATTATPTTSPTPTSYADYYVTSSAGSGGTITEGGFAYAGSSYTVTITPDSGYRILDVEVDGVSQGSISSYTFSDIQSDHDISATFSPTQGSASTLTSVVVVGIVVAVVVVVVVLFTVSRGRKQPSFSAPPPFPQTPICPTCGNPLIYVQQYQRWYCDREQKYV